MRVEHSTFMTIAIILSHLAKGKLQFCNFYQISHYDGFFGGTPSKFVYIDEKIGRFLVIAVAKQEKFIV